MTVVRTTLGLSESARRWRFEPTGNVSATNVQKAIEQVDTEAASKLSQVATIRLPASAATVAILTTDIEVGLDTTSTAVSATLPSAAAWAAANPNGLDLSLVDIKGNAGINNITPTLNGSDVFSYGGVTPVINGNFGVLRLRPTSTGWYVRGLA
jgi:hypothetical protein